MAHSVHDRLLNLSKQTDQRYNDLQQRFAMERFLYRLSISPFADQFTLKGALAFLAWTGAKQMYRSTMDIDLLGRTSNAAESLIYMFQTVARQEAPNDGLAFDPASVLVEPIAEDAEYQGMRVRLTGRLANARIAIQIDIGFSDTPVPQPERVELPGLLDFPATSMMGYRLETSIAEKLHTMVARDVLNSRMKDFADIWYLAQHFDFDGQTLCDAIAGTFQRRDTTIPVSPVALSAEFAQRQDKQVQWKAFTHRAVTTGIPADFAKIIEDIASFLDPILGHLVGGGPRPQTWYGGGPWQF